MNPDISFCRLSEIAEAMRFIGRFWAHGHVLSTSRKLMDWQHRSSVEGRDYDLVLARRAEDGEILGLLGFVSTRRYDPALERTNTLWFALWKVREDAGIAGLGLMMYRFLISQERHTGVGTLGISAQAERIYQALGYRMGVLNQYFLLNPSLKTYHLVRIPPHWKPPRAAHHGCVRYIPVDQDALRAMRIRDLDLGGRDAFHPAKTPHYFLQRYGMHPFYRYGVYLVVREGRSLGLAALRRIDHEGCRALRLVDYLGHEQGIEEAGPAFQALLEEHRAEYIDVLNTGLSESHFAGAGMTRVDLSGEVIIPNYFEPYQCKNVAVCYAFHAPDGRPHILFKADADQDRPNCL